MGHIRPVTHCAGLGFGLHLPDGREVSRDVCRLTPPYLAARLPLHCLDRIALCPKLRSQDFLIEGLQPNVIAGAPTLSDPKRRKGVHFVAEPSPRPDQPTSGKQVAKLPPPGP